ncbi:SAC3 GANP family protein [Cryptosporidium andersoni]|uniref:Eukaryotic translation initiation factor 3 subunit K n=1 Tax=Cryptosporidium andersoni TaxID=117008 RepID=A0A1J4MR39_9CRYT|nr:SAC3 GANP family protein [Cryptosporidium andersoni]
MSINNEVQVLLNSASRYDVCNLEVFEQCVRDQIKFEQYSIINNLAILRLYMIYPNKMKLDIIQDILLKALIQSPLSSDFLSCTYQIPLSIQDNPEIKPILFLHEMLIDCKFTYMWKFLKSNQLLSTKISRILGFEDFLRNIVVYTVNNSHSCISLLVLSELLDLPTSSNKIIEIIEKNGWRMDIQSGLIRIPAVENNENLGDTIINKTKCTDDSDIIVKNYLSILNSN